MALGRTLARLIRFGGRWLLGPLTLLGGFWWYAAGALGSFLPALMLCWCALLAAAFCFNAWKLHRRQGASSALSRSLGQLELVLLTGIFVVEAKSGGLASPVMPLKLLLLTVAGGGDSSNLNRWLLTCSALIGVALLGWREGSAQAALLQGVAVVLFPWSVYFLERLWVAAQRQRFQQESREHLERLVQEAKEYRLSGLTISHNPLPQEKRKEDLLRSSVEELGVGIQNILGLLHDALRPHVVAVYWLSTDEKTLSLRRAFPAEKRELLIEGPIPALAGLLGAVVQSRRNIRRENPVRSERGLVYYADPPAIKHFLAVPIIESQETAAGQSTFLRGVLLADRKVDIPFGIDDEKAMETAAREVVRILKVERQLNLLDRTRMESEALSQATAGLLRVSRLQEVAEECARWLRALFYRSELAVVLLKDGGNLALRAVSADESFDPWWQKARGQAARARGSLCALAMELGRVLPDREFSQRHHSLKRILDDRLDPPGLNSVMIAPLAGPGESGKDALGVLVVGSRQPAFFSTDFTRQEDARRTLETFANICAIGFQNAQRLERLEQMATTDALTGLWNRRRFFEMLAEAVAESQRYGRPLSLIMTDIDHFKKINDTYGHPVGDEVLKKVAGVLQLMARVTDRPCRLGGEEFALLAPETDAEGARQLAERIRQEVSRLSFQHGGKNFSVTLSLGICTMPFEARDEEQLMQRADEALYRAKNGGRNQVVVYSHQGSQERGNARQ